jgi:hypothetical protein
MIIDIKIYYVDKPQTPPIYIFIVRVASRLFSNKDSGKKSLFAGR